MFCFVFFSNNAAAETWASILYQIDHKKIPEGDPKLAIVYTPKTHPEFDWKRFEQEDRLHSLINDASASVVIRDGNRIVKRNIEEILDNIEAKSLRPKAISSTPGVCYDFIHTYSQVPLIDQYTYGVRMDAAPPSVTCNTSWTTVDKIQVDWTINPNGWPMKIYLLNYTPAVSLKSVIDVTALKGTIFNNIWGIAPKDSFKFMVQILVPPPYANPAIATYTYLRVYGH